MHGQPRVKDKILDPERVKAAAQKAALFGQLLDKVLTARRAHAYDQTSLDLSAKLLELNPEVYTVWNYRREALSGAIEAGGEAAVEAVAGELALTQRALMRNPKSYSTWHHRKWAVSFGACSLEREISLVEKLLEADDRNFHGWSYRRFIAQHMGMPAARELEFTMRKIEQNFSNYSAWHYRSTLLPVIHAAAEEVEEAHPAGDGGAEAGMSGTSASAAVPAEVLDEEFELVKQAFFTEPEDQSGWFYHRWLLGCSLARFEAARGAAGEAEAHVALLCTLRAQVETCEELLGIEPDAKWPLLTLTRLRQLQAQLGENEDNEGAEGRGEAAGAFSPEAAYRRLGEEDPARRGFYEDAAAGQANVVAVPRAVEKEESGITTETS